MAKEPEEKNDLTNVRITKIGLCRHPAVPEATHLIMKSRDSETEDFRQSVDPATRLVVQDQAIVQKAETFLTGLANLIKSIGGSEKKTETTETTDMNDISKATVEDIQKNNPVAFAAIQKAALDAVKDKNGSRVGAVDVEATVDEKDGTRVAGTKVAGVTDAAVDTKKDTVSSPKDDSQNAANGGVEKAIAELQKGLSDCTATLKAMCAKVEKFDTSRPGEAATDKEEKAAVKATQAAVDTTADSNGGVAKIDTSRPGEAAINTAEKKAVAATAAAVDASAKAGDSGIGAVEAGDGDKEKDAAMKAELGTLKEQVATLTKAVAMVIKKSAEQPAVVAKSVVVETVAKAGSKQVGQLDADGAKNEIVGKSVFGGAISTIALAKAGRGDR